MFQRDIDHNIQYFQHGISPLQCIIDTNFFKFIFLTIYAMYLICIFFKHQQAMSLSTVCSNNLYKSTGS